MTTAEHGHYRRYCDHCERETVICGRCNMNTCSGGYGVEVGPEPGSVITCRACPSAQELDQASPLEELPAVRS